MQRLFDYPDIQSAAIGLLGHTTSVVQKTGLPFAVIGGWSPFLLNNGAISHPGSRDVDLLFEEGVEIGSLKSVVEELLVAGYLLSAKHSFQVLRVLQVSGHEFVFNVDLLHASETKKNPDLFSDHVSLPVRLSEFTDETIPVRSIVVPISRFIFDGHIVNHQLGYDGIYSSDGKKGIAIPLMDELGTIVTKAESMWNVKRSRDVFDVMLALVQSRPAMVLVEQMQWLATKYPDAFAELTKLWAIVENPKFRENIEKFWPEAKSDGQWQQVSRKISDVLSHSNVPKPTGGTG